MPYSRRKSAPYKIGDFFNWKSLTSERLHVRREYEQVSQILQQQCYRWQPKRDDNITVGAGLPRPYNVVNSIENSCQTG